MSPNLSGSFLWLHWWKGQHPSYLGKRVLRPHRWSCAESPGLLHTVSKKQGRCGRYKPGKVKYAGFPMGKGGSNKSGKWMSLLPHSFRLLSLGVGGNLHSSPSPPTPGPGWGAASQGFPRCFEALVTSFQFLPAVFHHLGIFPRKRPLNFLLVPPPSIEANTVTLFL